jgi:hypothetical protein
MRQLLSFAVALAALSATGAVAAESTPAPTTQPAPQATVICVNAGNQYRVGEYACIAACHGQRRLARCDAVSQTGSWTYVSDVCPSALLPPSPMDATVKPIAVAMTPIPLPIEHLMSEMTPESWMHLVDAGKATATTQ